MPARKPREKMPANVREQVESLRHPNYYVRSRAADVLGSIGHVSAAPYLIKALQDKDSDVRLKAAEALGLVKHASAVLPLAKALQDERWEVRWRATIALGEIKHERAVPHLVNVLHDRDPDVKRDAAESLVSIGQAIQGKKVRGKEAKALQLVGAYFHQREAGTTIYKAYQAALKGKVTKENARLYVKQLRAVQGKLK